MHATKIPPGIPPELAAPLLCAGIAMYSSIKKTKTRPGDWIVILGAGGGLGHMGVQIAAKQGLRVIAVDKGEKKRQLCLSLGATEFVDFSEVDTAEAVHAITSNLGAHAVICTANGERAYEQSMKMLRRLGTLVCVGIPNVPFRLPVTPLDMIVKGINQPCLSIVGNSAGTAGEMKELMELAVAGDVKAHIEVYDLADIEDVLRRLNSSEIEGRAVLKIPA
ncbi:Alcohol dehydrogenase 1 [Penicillium macrosclerotiorum]|uniref:Alcohol dehydrogenase 1 n=1 Tax=Penicillium macrosclerotiorum TaxID=303699 RepID=UPI0025499233|nr:Alcohol dehydrogenase 1 [Penicillium macrosclerotiorum]KAJ5666868.1 Alcohol dehydrogenase 1 [Penicillium macrosclerotiorum]